MFIASSFFTVTSSVGAACHMSPLTGLGKEKIRAINISLLRSDDSSNKL